VRELRRAYYAALSYADSELGRILDELVDLGLYENTIVVFWGDHGWQLGEHAGWGKLTNFEIATRVPFMIRVPGVTDGGIRMSKMVIFCVLHLAFQCGL
jgi:iduronate 2-sulfatase